MPLRSRFFVGRGAVLEMSKSNHLSAKYAPLMSAKYAQLMSASYTPCFTFVSHRADSRSYLLLLSRGSCSSSFAKSTPGTVPTGSIRGGASSCVKAAPPRAAVATNASRSRWFSEETTPRKARPASWYQYYFLRLFSTAYFYVYFYFCFFFENDSYVYL